MFRALFSENRVVYEIMWKTVPEHDKSEVTIYCGTDYTPFVYRLFCTG